MAEERGGQALNRILVLDEALHRFATRLPNYGYEVVCLPDSITDEEIVARAAEWNAVIVTEDKRFAELTKFQVRYDRGRGFPHLLIDLERFYNPGLPVVAVVRETDASAM